MEINQYKFERWMVRLIGLFSAFMGLVNLASAIQPALLNRLMLIEKIFPIEFRHSSRIVSALTGFVLLLLASSLWRRKHVAWIVSMVVLVASFLSHLFKGLDVEEASLSLGLLILLILFRKSFHAQSDRPSIRQGLKTFGLALGFTIIYGVLGIYLLDRHFRIEFSLVQAIRQTITMFGTFNNPGLEATTRFGLYFVNSIYVIGLSTFSFAIIMLVRPVLVRLPATNDERKRAQVIVEKYGRTALARATLFEDKSYFFGPGETLIAYAVSRRGVIVLGDPIGPLDQIYESILAFRDFCARNDWSPAFASTLPDYLDLYRKAGFDVVCIGYEAIVDLGKFSLEGSQNKGVRNTVSRMDRNGFQTEIYKPPLQVRLLISLRNISDSWLTLRKGGEMHFSDGWFNDDYIRNSTVIVMHGPDGTPTAFANIISEYQKNELSIDLMRHYPKVENGTMEFLFARLLQWAKENGYETFSLGLSAIVGVGEKPDDPRVEQFLNKIAEYVSRFYNFRGLHNFKDKFHPSWEPRYLIYPSTTSLPLVLNSLLRVHSGNKFLWKFLNK